MSASEITIEFAELAGQFIDAMATCFADDVSVLRHQEMWRVTYEQVSEEEKAVLRDTMIAEYHAAVNQYYPLCLQRDERVFDADIDMLRDLGLKQKFEAGLHEQTADSIWQYIQRLNQVASLWSVYTRIPTGIMSSINGLQDTIQSQIQTDDSGNVDLSQLDMSSLTQQLMGSIDQGDMQQFAGSLQGEGGVGDIGSMFTMLAGLMQNMTGGEAPPTPAGLAATLAGESKGE